jgi:rsbT co-antagonist protein RsbR
MPPTPSPAPAPQLQINGVDHQSNLPMRQEAIEAFPFPLTIYTCDGLFVGANDLIEQLFQVPKSAVIGTFNLLTDPLAQDERTNALFQAALAGKRAQSPPIIYDFSYPRTRTSERASCWIETTYFPFSDAAGRVTHVGSIIQDVTERVMAEQAQQQRESELRLTRFALDRASDSFLWIDSSSKIVYANDKACEQLGYTHAELLEMRITDLDPIVPAHSWGAIWDSLKRERNQRFETVHRRKDGADIPVEVTSTYLEFEGHEFACTFSRDISDRQRAEEERVALQEQVIAAQGAALRELSTPLIPITDAVVAMPLIGSIDSSRAQLVLETLLTGVAERQASITIIDITGVPVVDTQVANALIRAAQAVKLLGARVILTGIRPEVAQTLVNLGVDLSGILTRGTLQGGIAEALGQQSERSAHGRR